MQRSVVSITGQDRGERVSLILVAQASIGLGRGHIAREIENARRVIGLPEVIKEDALLASELDGMSSFYPLQGRRVADQLVLVVGVNAALGNQRQDRVMGPDGRHA